MDLIHGLALGVHVAFTLQNLGCAFFGALLGTLIGVLPGVGLVAAIAMLLPFIHALDATPALIMLAGIYCGAQYGGATAALLSGVPGAPGSVVTAIDGHPMARQGRAGAALSVAVLGSFFAGCVGIVIIATFAPALAGLASGFGPAENFSLIVLGLIGAAVLASGSLIKALCMILLGLLLGQVNTDAISGVPRFSFDTPELARGIGFVGIAMGVFGFSDIVCKLGQPRACREVLTRDVMGLWPTMQDFRDAWPSVLRGTALGSVLGVLPGGGARLASFTAYSVEEKAVLKPRIPFGQGAIQGVAGPESANNAGVQTSFMPMLTLGIPPNAVMALIVGAMAVKGIQPGPQVMSAHPDLFWGLIASLWVGNAMLVILNLPLIGIWIKLLTVPYRYLFPAIMVFGCIGLYTLNNSNFDVYIAALCGLAGYLFVKLGCEPAPLLLGYILGPMMEENLRRALLLSRGDWSTFVTRPLSAGLLIAAALMIFAVTLPTISSKREVAFKEE